MEKVIFWDWSGTLADESALDKSVCLSMEEEITRREQVSLEEAANQFNRHLKKLENTWKWHDYVFHGESFSIDWKQAQENHLDKLSLLPYAREILEHSHAQGYKNILASNAVRPVILLRVAHTGLLDLFDFVIASDDVGALKSEGKHFTLGLDQLKADPAISFSVGDNPVQDIRPAHRLGLHTIFCAYGKKRTHYHSEHLTANHSESVEADFIIHSLEEIKEIIKNK
jgi:HAD superfamily hydrolase (TIGR01549 family)